ncbi:MAG: ABC transporter transmembrane domain-containing protein, partial [Alphaproteobacteria bacterium]
MTDQASQPASKPRVSSEEGALTRTIINLWPFIWPSERADLQMRVVWALGMLFIAKLITMVVPFTFKWATDALTSPQAQTGSWWLWVIAAPITLTIAYGSSRILMAMFTQLRDGLFAKVSMHAVRRLALITFEHMHKLSLRFHLERKTGGLTRILERGRNGIETIVRMIMLQLAPTILELALILGVLLWIFDWRYAVVVAATVGLYLWFTYSATEWRIGIRRDMNDSDNRANVKAIDSLLNYETVKYFGAEAREKARYDVSMEKYESASTKAYTSLAVLNAGQAAIFTAGMTVCMVMCAIDIQAGRNTIGDFVMINAMM